MEGLIQMVESTQLNISIYGCSTYSECLRLVESTPQLLGVLSIDYVVTNKTEKFYKNLIERLDIIAKSLERPLVLSVLYKSSRIVNYIKHINSEYISISILKYTNLNEEIIRLDGIVPIIVSTLGVYKVIEKKIFVSSVEDRELVARNELINALIYILSDNPNPEILNSHLKKYPELRKINSLRTHPENKKEIMALYKNTFLEIFCDAIAELTL